MASLGLYLNEDEYAQLKTGRKVVIESDCERIFIQHPDGNYSFAEVESAHVGEMYGQGRKAMMVLRKEK